MVMIYMHKSFEATDNNDESTHNDFFMEDIDPSIWYSLWECWSTRPQADATHIRIKAQSLLAIQKGAIKLASTGNQVASSKQYWQSTWNKLSADAIKFASSTWPTRLFRLYSISPPVVVINTPAASHIISDTLSLSLTLPSLTGSVCEVCYNPSQLTLRCPVLSRDTLLKLKAIHEGNMKKKPLGLTPTSTTSWPALCKEPTLP